MIEFHSLRSIAPAQGTRWRSLLFVTTLWVGMTMAVPVVATAAPTLDFGPVEINVSSEFMRVINLVSTADGGVVEPGDPTMFASLLQPDLFFRFPTSPSQLPAGFVSSAFSGERKGGVGVSGFVFRDQTRGTAEATYLQAILNLGDEDSGQLDISYTIPRMEAAIFPGSSVGANAQSFASALLIATTFDMAGTELSRDRVFSYELSQSTPPPGGGDGIFRSPDLRDEHGDGLLISTSGVRGVQYGQFEGQRKLPAIPAGGRLEIQYMFVAGGSTVSREHGFQAFVGDPFNISGGGGGFEISLAQQPGEVPEPATSFLIGGCLVAAVCWRTLRNALHGGRRTDPSKPRFQTLS